MTEETDSNFLRRMLALYDEGILTDGELAGRIFDRYLMPMVETAQSRECGHFTSVCGGEDMPHNIKRCIVEIGRLGKPVWFKPMPKQRSTWTSIKRFFGICRAECDGMKCAGYTECDR